MWIALAVIAIAIVALLAFAATKPATFRVQRTESIRATPDAIYPYVEDFHKWRDWSPYENIDPNLKRTYGGAPNGKGATYQWEGNGKVGAGRMEIINCQSPSRIDIKLDFTKPFQASNIAEFRFEPEGSYTNVTWATHGPNLFITKVMSTFVSMDNLIGKDFAKGLANLKAIAEK